MKLQELNDAYNALRNDALGRNSTTPLVSPELAAKVGNVYERFRMYMGNAGVLDDVFADLTARGWVTQYQALAAEVKSEGKLKTAPDGNSFKSKLQDMAEDTAAAASAVATGIANTGQAVLLVAAAIGLPLLFVLMRGARR